MRTDRAEDMEISLASVETPAAVLDVHRVRANAARAAAYLKEHGLTWRPHVKTHKSRRVTSLQLEAGAVGVTVATLREAEVMSTVCDDILLAYPPVGEAKLRRLLSLSSRVRLTVALDDPGVLRELGRAAALRERRVGVLVEVDAGMRRVGVQGIPAAVSMARLAANTPGVEYRGVLHYPGHIRDTGGPEGERALGELGRTVEELLDRLGSAGLTPEVVSGGSTPTLWRSHELGGLTEVRSGTVIFNDRDTRSLGAAAPEGLAFSVLATVVSTAVPGRAVIDAGSKALAREPLRGPGEGLGELLDRPEVTVVSMSEEHGILDLSESDWRPQVGDRVQVVPNHVCVCVNLQDRFLAVEGERVEAWEIEARGRGPFSGEPLV